MHNDKANIAINAFLNENSYALSTCNINQIPIIIPTIIKKIPKPGKNSNKPILIILCYKIKCVSIFFFFIYY